MPESSAQTQANGRTHFIGLGGAPLSDALRGQLETLGHIEWVGNIYAVAAEHAQRRHNYRALLLDLRTLARPELDNVLALGRRTGLPIWLLPVGGGRTREAAALAGGAILWPQMAEQFQKLERSQHEVNHQPVEIPIHKAASISAATIAARLSEALSVEPHFDRPRNGHTPSAAQERIADKVVEILHGNGPIGKTGMQEKQTVRDAEQQPVTAENGDAESNGAGSAAHHPPAPVFNPSPLRGLPARLFEAAPARSENVKPVEIQQNKVTSPLPAEYDEISPVLSEEELRALLGPPE